MPQPVEQVDRLTEADAAAVSDLVDRVTRRDGASPLSEAVRLGLAQGVEPGRQHLLLRASPGLSGYAQLRLDDDATHAELAVMDADSARTLIAEIGDAVPGTLRVWAHGERSGLAPVLAGLGFTGDRVLLQLRRPLVGSDAQPLASPVWPAGVAVRTFIVGQDEAAWLAVNHAAFAGHPEQSRWQLDDLTRREDAAWFDPAGFFLAERNGELVGFHWTKVHAGSEPIGEVYVVGVAPSMQGERLGSALTLRGLIHLRDLDLSAVMLYVDESNTSAVHVYERLGFLRWDSDTSYVR